MLPTLKEQLRAAGIDPDLSNSVALASVALPTARDAYVASLAAQEREMRALIPHTVGECLSAQQRAADQQAALGADHVRMQALASNILGTLGEAERRRLSGYVDAKEYSVLVSDQPGSLKPK